MHCAGYGKMSRNAIAATSYLARHYHDEQNRFSSGQIAEARNLSRPLVAKILGTLSTAKFINGSPGPNGGYSLARPPHEISFLDIVNLFENVGDADLCPFGPGWCGTGPNCPVHDDLVRLSDTTREFLADTHFGVFIEAN